MACKVFVSSTTLDLYKYRDVARDVIRRVNETFGGRFPIVPMTMDNQTQDAEEKDGERNTPLDDSRQWVRSSDWVVLIVAWNYGYVPPNESCSVTEWEYREAVHSGKKCFVFLAGDTDFNDPLEHQYWPIDKATEGVNLLTFRGHPEHRTREEALGKFKVQLREKRFTLFGNIEDFRVKLTATLSNKIIMELFRDLGPQIVALGLQPPLQACIGEVKVLVRLKRLHDRLHQIRQIGIRRWRESLLTRWPDDADPPWQAEKQYMAGLPEIRELIGKIGEVTLDLPEELRQALPSLKQVVEHQFPQVPDCGKHVFADSTEAFASRVQKAFTGCNLHMRLRAQLLDQDYRSLSDSTRRALERNQIPSNRKQLLQTELEAATQIHHRLQRVLENHYQWQDVHDELERIDNGIESDGPGDDDDKRNTRERDFRRAVADITESCGADIRALLERATTIVTQDEGGRLKLWSGLILKVSGHLDTFVSTPNVQHYQDMRTHFDDLFFEIDIETLKSVETSEGRVKAIEAGLHGMDEVPTTRPGDL
jgi:hypothetical protein